MKFTSLFFFILILSVGSRAQNEKRYESSNYFIENSGQLRDQNSNPVHEVLYKMDMPALNVQLRKTGISYDSYQINENIELVRNSDKKSKTSVDFHRVDLNFMNCNSDFQIIEFGKSSDYNNYYNVSDKANGITHVHSYKKIIYKNIYENIDIEFVAGENSKPFEYNFILNPGADIDDIQIEIKGAPFEITKSEIVFATQFGKLTETIPASWFLDPSGLKTKTVIAYKFLGNSKFGFEIQGKIKSGATLVIDPSASVDWSTYYGGSTMEYGYGIATNSNNDLFISGQTYSTTQIATSGTHQTTINSFSDAYLAKFNSSGVRQWGTYFGGNDADEARSCSIDNNGFIYISGGTSSASGVATGGSHQTSFGGTQDAFLAKFNSNGTLSWATYLGGTGTDFGYSCVNDNSGNIYISGETDGTNGIAFGSSHQSSNGGGSDAFVAKFNSGGVIQWGTYYGGTGTDYAMSVTKDNSGNIYCGGSTTSSTAIATAGTFQTTSGAGFITKFNSSGVRQWGTYLNGEVASLAVDGLTNIYAAAGPGSGMATAGTHSMVQSPVALVKFDSNGGRIWGTYLGDASILGEVYTCSVDSNNDVYIGGTGAGTGITTVGSHQTVAASTQDGFIVKFNSSGLREWGTFFGGGDYDYVIGSVCNSLGLFVTGFTLSSNLISTPGAHQTTNGGLDAFLTHFSQCDLDIDVTASQNPICAGGTTSVTVTAVGGQSPFTGTGTFTSGVGTTLYTISDGAGCTASENFTISAIASPTQDVCLVTTDSATATYNIVVWEKPLGTLAIDSFYIYREVSASVYTKIGAVAYEDSSIFEDFNANPNQQSWKYKISVLDTCGAESPKSLYHETIHLQYLANGNFSWNHYIIEPSTNPVSNYIIEKDDAGTGANWYIIGAPVGNSFTDIAYAATPNAIYRVYVSWAISCTPSRAGVNTSRSNIKNQGISNDILEILENQIQVYPNPATTLVRIKSIDFYPITNYRLMDETGRIILSEKIHKTELIISLENLSDGIYFIELETSIGKVIRKVSKQ